MMAEEQARKAPESALQAAVRRSRELVLRNRSGWNEIERAARSTSATLRQAGELATDEPAVWLEE